MERSPGAVRLHGDGRTAPQTPAYHRVHPEPSLPLVSFHASLGAGGRGQSRPGADPDQTGDERPAWRQPRGRHLEF